MLAEDGAYVRAVVVAVVQRLDDHDAEVQSAVELVFDGLVGFRASRGCDQLIPGTRSQLFQHINSGPRVVLEATLTPVAKPTKVALLTTDQMLPRSRERAVRARSGQLKLLLRQLPAHVQELQVGPLVVAERLGQQFIHSASILEDLVSCQGMALDILQARGRALALFERYGTLLTDHQREVVDLYLRSDWSLAEIAKHQGTSRAAVHDIVRRSTLALQEYERRLGLLSEAARRRRALDALERELDGLKRRLSRLEATT